MGKYITAFQMTQSMFCSLPFPCKVWKEECRSYMLVFLPVIGLEIGALWLFLDYILRFFEVPSLIYGLVMCAMPYLATGFMHLDGFMDVVDAVCSWRDLEKRRAILKDSHVGSFAVVWCVFLILTGFAMFSAVPMDANMRLIVFVPVISRCCSALAIMRLKTMNTSQYAQAEKYPVWHQIALVFVILISLILGYLLGGIDSLALVACFLGYAIALKKSYTSLQGMNGDISGFCICISELCAISMLALL